MKACANCGYANLDKAKTCVNCRTDLQWAKVNLGKFQGTPEETVEIGLKTKRERGNVSAQTLLLADALPNVGIGIAFAAMWLVVAGFSGVYSNPPTTFLDYALRFLPWLISIIYWLYCLYVIHKVLNAHFPDYPIKPVKAVVGMLIPVFSFYWIFEWPHKFAWFLNRNVSRRIAPGVLYGGLFLACFLVQGLGISWSAVGWIGIFLITEHMVVTLRNTMMQSS